MICHFIDPCSQFPFNSSALLLRRARDNHILQKIILPQYHHSKTITMAPIEASLPKTQKAIIAGEDRQPKVVFDQPVLPLAPNAIIIKVHAVALNPVDTKLSGPFVTPGVIFGFDCSGTVVAVGSDVKKNWQIGDRALGSACGMDPTQPSGGAFTEYTALPGDMALRIPDSMSFEDAATLPTAINTSVLALFWSMKIPMSLIDTPAEKPFPVLVYGGSTSVGGMAIQILKL
jgi:NADPH:quinone reductase-like Zn-dependent oxidoreductase